MNHRIERVMDKMKQAGIPQMLVTDPHSLWYLTGIYVDPFERMLALLLRADGEHVFFANRLFYIHQDQFREVQFIDADDSIGLLVEELRKPISEEALAGASANVLGIDKAWSARFLIPLQERSPEFKTVLASDCVDECRACKDAEEQELMRKASQINDAVMERAAAYVKEGITEAELAQYIDEEYQKEGCEGNSFPTIVCFGANAADQHHVPDNTVLKEGDCILIDMGCRWKRYCSDMTRTYFYKSVDPGYAAIHDLVRSATEKAESIIKPGVRFCDIDAAARDMIIEAGYGKNFYTRLGHFIGQEDHEKGDVSALNTSVAEPGMIFSIEPGVYLDHEFGVRVEDLVLVTEDGCEILNKVDKNYKILG